MATFSDNKRRGCFERPDYTGGTPERHAPHEVVGTTKQGVPIHGSHVQPWVENDPILPDPTSAVDNRRSDGKDDVG
jgi:hypothetical protein